MAGCSTFFSTSTEVTTIITTELSVVGAATALLKRAQQNDDGLDARATLTTPPAFPTPPPPNDLSKRQASSYCPNSAPYFFGTDLCGTTSFCQADEFRACTSNPAFPYLSIGDCQNCYATGVYTQFEGLLNTSPSGTTTTPPVTSTLTLTLTSTIITSIPTSTSCPANPVSSASSPSRTGSTTTSRQASLSKTTTTRSSGKTSGSSTSTTSASSSSRALAPDHGNKSHSSFPTGAVAGGVVGGLALIALLGLITYFLFRRKGNEDDAYTPALPPQMSEVLDPPPPKPDYGSAGSTTSSSGAPYGGRPYAPIPPPPSGNYYEHNNYGGMPYAQGGGGGGQGYDQQGYGNGNAYGGMAQEPYHGPSEIPYVSAPVHQSGFVSGQAIPPSLLPGQPMSYTNVPQFSPPVTPANPPPPPPTHNFLATDAPYVGGAGLVGNEMRKSQGSEAFDRESRNLPSEVSDSREERNLSDLGA